MATDQSVCGNCGGRGWLRLPTDFQPPSGIKLVYCPKCNDSHAAFTEKLINENVQLRRQTRLLQGFYDKVAKERDQAKERIEKLIDDRNKLNESWNERCMAAELKIRMLQDDAPECTCDFGEGKEHQHDLECPIAVIAQERDDLYVELLHLKEFVRDLKEHQGDSRMLRELFAQGPDIE